MSNPWGHLLSMHYVVIVYGCAPPKTGDVAVSVAVSYAQTLVVLRALFDWIMFGITTGGAYRARTDDLLLAN
jgi:hypothetical protein